MFKKILLIIIAFFSLFLYYSTLAAVTQNITNYNNISQQQKNTINKLSQKKYGTNAFKVDKNGKIGNVVANGVLNDNIGGVVTNAANKVVNTNKKKATVQSKSNNSKTDISKPSFVIGVDKISPGNNNLKGNTAKETATKTLQKIIDNLMIAFGVLALLVMTIGGGYMIMYHGQDELLSKGKSIFNSGLIALVVALSAGILVKLVAYLIY